MMKVIKMFETLNNKKFDISCNKDTVLFNEKVSFGSTIIINLNTLALTENIDETVEKDKRGLLSVNFYNGNKKLDYNNKDFFKSKIYGKSHYFRIEDIENNFSIALEVPKDATRVEIVSIPWKCNDFNLNGSIKIININEYVSSNIYEIDVYNCSKIYVKGFLYIPSNLEDEIVNVYIDNRKYATFKISKNKPFNFNLSINNILVKDKISVKFQTENGNSLISEIIKTELIKFNFDKENFLISPDSNYEKIFKINSFFDYTISANIPDISIEQEKALLLFIKVYDKSGKEILDRINGFNKSNKYINYRYIDIYEKDNKIKILFESNNARYISVNLITWRSKNSFSINDFLIYEKKVNLNGLNITDINENMNDIMNTDLLKAKQLFTSHIEEYLNKTNIYAKYNLSKILSFKLGKINEAIRNIDEQIILKNDKKLYLKRRSYQGIINELNTSWLPSYTKDIEELRIDKKDTKLRILHLIKTAYPYETTGGSIRCQETFLSQKDAGLEPLALTPLGYPGLVDVAFPQENIVNGVNYVHNNFYDTEAKKLPFDERDKLDTFFAASVVRKFKPNIIHAASGIRGMELALKGLALKKQFNIPFIYEVRSFHEHTWGPMGEIAEKAELTKLRINQENRCMQEADLVITICETMKKAIVSRGINIDKVKVIPNAINPDKFVVEEQDKNLKESLSLNKTVIGYISNLSRREGHALLIEAFNKLAKTRDDISLLIVGIGPEFDNLNKLVDELDIKDKVKITGAVEHEEINKYYQLIDIFVIPRLPDYASDMVTPLKPFEALALQRALLVSDREVLSEIVKEGKTGMMFKTGDVNDLAKKIELLIKNSSLRKQFGMNGRKWVLENRTWKLNAEKYLEIYNSIIK
jgi:glycosyltransferase involved in cell wall biosynthesis